MAERKNVNNGDWDAKGDLLAGTANDAFDQVAVGANNTILTADSTVATGMKWAAPAAPTGVVLVSDFDAKGDLLVGTANDAFDQLAVGTNGKMLEAASGETTGLKYDWPPGYEIAYAEVTSDVVVTATADPGNLIVSLGAVTYEAIPTMFNFYFPAHSPVGAVTNMRYLFMDDTTIVNILAFQAWNASISGIRFMGGTYSIRLTPSAGSHTYNVKAYRAAGTSVTVEATTTGVGDNFAPIWLRATIV